jgi:hypothetical protein
MPSSLRNPFLGWAAVIALAGWGGPLAGCAKEGTTPTCNDNVTEEGMQSDVEDPCNAFGVCIKGGDVRPAAECCVDADNQPLTGGRLAACLYGFGEFDPPDGAGGTGGGG